MKRDWRGERDLRGNGDATDEREDWAARFVVVSLRLVFGFTATLVDNSSGRTVKLELRDERSTGDLGGAVVADSRDGEMPGERKAATWRRCRLWVWDGMICGQLGAQKVSLVRQQV